MNSLQQLRIRGVVLLLTFLTAGCFTPTDKVIYKGTHNGLNFTVKAHETHTWNGSRIDWILKLDGHPELPIIITKRWGTPVEPDGIISTDWGPPYSDALYGKFSRMYLGNAPAYVNIGDNYRDSVARQHDYTMLYMPVGSDEKDFAAYSSLMKAEWAAVDKALTMDDTGYFPHLIGLVGAPREIFVQRFRGSKNGVTHVLRVDPDGYVNFGIDDGSADKNHDRHSPVQMPQKEILLHTIYTIDADGWQLDDLRNMKDQKGKRVEAYFKVSN
jgi:hypothetical protein